MLEITRMWIARRNGDFPEDSVDLSPLGSSIVSLGPPVGDEDDRSRFRDREWRLKLLRRAVEPIAEEDESPSFSGAVLSIAVGKASAIRR